MSEYEQYWANVMKTPEGDEAMVEIIQNRAIIQASQQGEDVRVEIRDMSLTGASSAPEESAVWRADHEGAMSLAVAMMAMSRRARGGEEHVYTTRPIGVDDIHDLIAFGKPIDRLNISEYVAVPRALDVVAGFLENLRALGMSVRVEYSTAVVYRDMTPEEKLEALDEAQRAWDNTKALYEEAVVRDAMPSSRTEAAAVEVFCEREGLDLPGAFREQDLG